MARPRPDRVHLRRIDPDRAMGRFYSLALQPTLLGGVDLVRRWGRTGTGGASLIRAFRTSRRPRPLSTRWPSGTAGAATSDPRIPRRSVPLSPARTSLT